MTEQKKDIFDLSETEFIEYFKGKIFSLYCNIKNRQIKAAVPYTGTIVLSIVASILVCYLCMGICIYLNITFDLEFLVGAATGLATFFSIPILSSLVIYIIDKKAPRKIVNLESLVHNKNMITYTGTYYKKPIFEIFGIEYYSTQPDVEIPFNRRIDMVHGKSDNFGCGKIRGSQNNYFYIDIRKLKNECSDFQKLLTKLGKSNGGIEEVFKGSYHNTPFTIIEQGNADGFYNITLITKISKIFKGDIKINSSSSISDYNLQPVNLEDIRFSKEYNVYAQDQVEARYILTPTFMERLQRYKKIKLCDIDVFLSQRYPEYGNVFFYIKTGQNMFELPINENLGMEARARAVYNVLFEMRDILRIVDTLKLDQDIGM